MTDKEKLIEILKLNLFLLPSWQCTYEEMADSLLADGVVVREWIPVTERLPDRDSTVLAFYETMRGTSAAVQVTKGWNIYGTATHWMPLPEPPKEGE